MDQTKPLYLVRAISKNNIKIPYGETPESITAYQGDDLAGARDAFNALAGTLEFCHHIELVHLLERKNIGGEAVYVAMCTSSKLKSLSLISHRI